LARQYGCAAKPNKARDRLTGGGRILVFSQKFTRRILGQPTQLVP
jgi:hypothetical protein